MAKCASIAPLAKAVQGMENKADSRDQWYEGILNALPWAIAVTDMNMNWTFCNTALAQIHE